jgi:uncharacterized metal-binding protein
MAKRTPQCSKCPSVVCSPPIGATARAPLTEAPAFCPMKNEAGVLKKALSEYQKPSIKEFARQASIQEFECYENTPQGRRTRNPRIVELIEFGKKMGYKKLGLAFCAGLHAEAETVTRILENSGYEVVSARCKMGAVPKEFIGIQPGEKIGGPLSCETMCNPIAQAKLLNSQKVDLAIMLGLCLGHDTLFFQYCRVPTTVLAVKDRVTGHNPLAAIYLSSSYYGRLTGKGISPGIPAREARNGD